MRRNVYLDYHATTPVDSRVIDAMLPYFGVKFGNAASRGHSFGWEAEKAVDLARQRLAALAGATARELVFTSGATESNNLAIKGSGAAHVVTMGTEHKSVLVSAKRLGCRLTVLAPRRDGLVDLDAVRDAIGDEPTLVSIMYANNESGTVQPIREIGAICRDRGALLHCDAAQAYGKIPVNVEADSVDLLSITAHKMYGPKGVGALYVRRRRARLVPQIDGGGHEGGMRSGTLNVPGIVGFGEAAEIASREMAGEAAQIAGLRDRLLKALAAEVELSVNGSMERRLPGNLSVSFPGVKADAILLAAPEVALSTGSACTSASVEPSHVLLAIGLSTESALSTVRFGLGRFTTEDEVDYAAGRVVEVVKRLRSLTPV
jgi:cysteine desulfurase